MQSNRAGLHTYGIFLFFQADQLNTNFWMINSDTAGQFQHFRGIFKHKWSTELEREKEIREGTEIPGKYSEHLAVIAFVSKS